MRFSILLFSAILFTGCGTSETVSNTATNANTAVVVNNNASDPLATAKTPEAATVNNAPTVAPVVAAYYEALKKKDDAALQKIFSQETLKSYQSDMKDEKQKSLAEFLISTEKVPDKPFEARNETVDGDSIIAERRGGSYPNGIKIRFVKENGAWKMTNESPEVKMSDAPSNSAK